MTKNSFWGFASQFCRFASADADGEMLSKLCILHLLDHLVDSLRLQCTSVEPRKSARKNRLYTCLLLSSDTSLQDLPPINCCPQKQVLYSIVAGDRPTGQLVKPPSSRLGPSAVKATFRNDHILSVLNRHVHDLLFQVLDMLGPLPKCGGVGVRSENENAMLVLTKHLTFGSL